MPKTLYLVRHAKSEGSIGSSDFDRPLNQQGLREAAEMGQKLKTADTLPEQILCSPAKRAVQTLENMNLGIEAIVFKKSIYDALSETLLGIIQSLENSCNSAMLIGHNPSITTLSEYLIGSPIGNLPPCSIVTIQLDSDHWNLAGKCGTTRLGLDKPKRDSKSGK